MWISYSKYIRAKYGGGGGMAPASPLGYATGHDPSSPLALNSFITAGFRSFLLKLSVIGF
jgi:hypothetical protein